MLRDVREARWIPSLIGGGVLVGVLWNTLNGVWKVNGLGVFERAPWPLPNMWICVAAGAVIAAGVEVARAFWQRNQTSGIAELAERLRLNFTPDVDEQRLKTWKQLPLVERSDSAINGLSGDVRGTPVLMCDIIVPERSDGETKERTQTVVLLRLADQKLPAFELQPRQRRFSVAAMLTGDGLRFAEDELQTPHAAIARQFNRHYDLTPGLLDDDSEDEADELPRVHSSEKNNVAAIHSLFSVPVVRFFADHPHWCVQASGRQLIVWKHHRQLAASDRQEFLEEALELRELLLKSLKSSSDKLPLSRTEIDDPKARKTIVAATTVSGGIGFLLGGLIGLALFAWLFLSFIVGNPDRFFPWVFLPMILFFVLSFGGLAFGAHLGRTRIGPAWARRQKEADDARVQSVGSRPHQQPPLSKAIVSETANELVVEFPPPGLVRGCGFGLFGWVLFWNLLVFAFSTLFLLQAVRGQVRGDDGQPVAVWFLALFLSPFWLTGLGGAAAIVHFGRRCLRLTLGQEQLSMERRSPIRSSRDEWPLDELTTARVQSGGASRYQLVVLTSDRTRYELLSGRDYDELSWLAKLIRSRYRWKGTDDAE